MSVLKLGGVGHSAVGRPTGPGFATPVATLLG